MSERIWTYEELLKTVEASADELAALKAENESLKIKYEEAVLDSQKTDDEIQYAVSEALRDSEEKYRRLFEAVSDPIFLVDIESSRILEANAAAVDTYGYEYAELLTKLSTDMSAEPEQTHEAAHSSATYVPTRRHRKKDGTVFPIEISASRFLWKDRPAILVAVRDITKRKDAEEQRDRQFLFAKALNEIADVIISTDSFEEILENTNRILGETLKVDRTLIYDVSFKRDSIIGLCEWLKEKHHDIAPTKGEYPLDAFRIPFTEIMKTKNYLVSHFDAVNEHFSSDGSGIILHEQMNIKSLIWYPFAFEENGYHVFTINQILEIRRWTQEDIVFIESVANQVSWAFLKIKLRESELRYRLLSENVTDGVSLFEDNKIKYVSRGYCKIFGFENRDIENISFEEIFSFIYKDDVARILQEIQNAHAQRASNLLYSYRVKSEAGALVWVEDSVNIEYDAGGNHLRSIIHSRDITERKRVEEALKESEGKFSTLFSSMTEMVVTHELVFDENDTPINYRITDCNNAFTEVTGIPYSAAAGRLATDVYQIETPPYLEEFSTVAISGKPYEYTTYFQPMDKHFAISVVSPKKNHFATVTTDITTFKQIQEIISAKNKELESYLYITSHDLRSPLINIQGFSQRLQKNIDSIKKLLSDSLASDEHNSFDDNTIVKINSIMNNTIPETIDSVFANVKKMDVLINALLQISRTGRGVPAVKAIDMKQLFYSIISAKKFELTEISAHVNLQQDMPGCYGDENMLNQLFSNLIANAINYRDENRKLVVDITAQVIYYKVIYSIKDNGIGISARHLERIWDVFYRVDSGPHEAGQGIGLSIVKRIIDKHKGRVWVESEEGKGSVFFVELQKNEFEPI